MRTPILAGLFAASSLALITGASAQVVVGAPLYEGRSVLAPAPDEEVVVREYIIRRPALPPAAVVAPAPVPPAPIPHAPVAYLRPGAIVPADVDIEPYVDAPVPAWRRYSYFTSPSNQIVLVDPLERRVVRVIERY